MSMMFARYVYLNGRANESKLAKNTASDNPA
jgi:hypothetical protein